MKTSTTLQQRARASRKTGRMSHVRAALIGHRRQTNKNVLFDTRENTFVLNRMYSYKRYRSFCQRDLVEVSRTTIGRRSFISRRSLVTKDGRVIRSIHLIQGRIFHSVTKPTVLTADEKSVSEGIDVPMKIEPDGIALRRRCKYLTSVARAGDTARAVPTCVAPPAKTITRTCTGTMPDETIHSIVEQVRNDRFARSPTCEWKF